MPGTVTEDIEIIDAGHGGGTGTPAGGDDDSGSPGARRPVARRKLESGAREAFRTWWALTTGLGLLFLAGQIIAWRGLAAAGMLLSTNPSSSFFYLLTAAHGAHLAGGIFALLYVTFRQWKRSRISQATAAELTSIYWHFMDGLWVFLLVLLTLGR